MDDLQPIELAALATMVRRLIHNAYGATLVGNPAKVTEEFLRRVQAVKVGDLVAEASTVYRSRGTSDLDALGILEEIAWEPVQWSDPEFVWDEAVEGEPEPTEKVFYIRTLDGRRFRWINADFIAAPVELRS